MRPAGQTNSLPGTWCMDRHLSAEWLWNEEWGGLPLILRGGHQMTPILIFWVCRLQGKRGTA